MSQSTGLEPQRVAFERRIMARLGEVSDSVRAEQVSVERLGELRAYLFGLRHQITHHLERKDQAVLLSELRQIESDLQARLQRDPSEIGKEIASELVLIQEQLGRPAEAESARSGLRSI